MVNREDPTGHPLELAGSATLATARPRTTLAAVARPAAEAVGLLLVEVLAARGPGRPRSACTIADTLAGRSAPTCLGWC